MDFITNLFNTVVGTATEAVDKAQAQSQSLYRRNRMLFFILAAVVVFFLYNYGKRMTQAVTGAVDKVSSGVKNLVPMSKTSAAVVSEDGNTGYVMQQTVGAPTMSSSCPYSM